VKAVPLAETEKGPFSDGSYADVQSGKYPLWRFLFVYVNKAPNKAIDPLQAEFIKLKDGIIRPPAKTPEERVEMVNATGQKIYAVLQEVIEERQAERKDDFISMFLDEARLAALLDQLVPSFGVSRRMPPEPHGSRCRRRLL